MLALLAPASSFVALHNAAPSNLDLSMPEAMPNPDTPNKGGDPSGQDPEAGLPDGVPNFEFPSQYAKHYFGTAGIDYMDALRDMIDIARNHGWIVDTSPDNATAGNVHNWSMPSVQGPADAEPRTDGKAKFFGLLDAIVYAADLGDLKAQKLLAAAIEAGAPVPSHWLAATTSTPDK